ncbi:MAG: Uma2 family endonuclease [Lachnospiraceae bacterium]|nr:Uma2 family endonuclease [Lachnospiraceae bacterium]
MDAALRFDSCEKQHTVGEIEALPDGKRAELIDGAWYDMASPSATHQLLVGAIYAEIRNHIKRNEGKCRTFVSPFAVYINKDEYNYLEPDVMVICDKDKLDEKGCHGAPDMVVEVVSPSSRKNDYILKLSKYATTGVREYWIVDPDSRITCVYTFEKDRDDGGFDLKQYDFDKPVESNIYPGLSILMTDGLQ